MSEPDLTLAYLTGYHKRDEAVRLLLNLLREIWEHRNGGSALSSSWDRRVTEVLETNGPT